MNRREFTKSCAAVPFIGLLPESQQSDANPVVIEDREEYLKNCINWVNHKIKNYLVKYQNLMHLEIRIGETKFVTIHISDNGIVDIRKANNNRAEQPVGCIIAFKSKLDYMKFAQQFSDYPLPTNDHLVSNIKCVYDFTYDKWRLCSIKWGWN